MKLAYCTSRRCDPKQLSAKGALKPEAMTGSCSCKDCGGIIVWIDSASKFRPGVTFHGKFKREREDEVDKNILTITA